MKNENEKWSLCSLSFPIGGIVNHFKFLTNQKQDYLWTSITALVPVHRRPQRYSSPIPAEHNAVWNWAGSADSFWKCPWPPTNLLNNEIGSYFFELQETFCLLWGITEEFIRVRRQQTPQTQGLVYYYNLLKVKQIICSISKNSSAFEYSVLRKISVTSLCSMWPAHILGTFCEN